MGSFWKDNVVLAGAVVLIWLAPALTGAEWVITPGRPGDSEPSVEKARKHKGPAWTATIGDKLGINVRAQVYCRDQKKYRLIGYIRKPGVLAGYGFRTVKKGGLVVIERRPDGRFWVTTSPPARYRIDLCNFVGQETMTFHVRRGPPLWLIVVICAAVFLLGVALFLAIFLARRFKRGAEDISA